MNKIKRHAFCGKIIFILRYTNTFNKRMGYNGGLL